MSHAYFVGIDPGRTGTISLLTADYSGPTKYWVMPRTPTDLWDLFVSIREHTGGDQFVLLEKVHSMPKDSAKGAFTFGKGVGYLEMAIIGTRLLPQGTVQPKVWMGALNSMTKGDKEISRAKAQVLFPEFKIKNKDHADGLLIGYYARLKYGAPPKHNEEAK